MDSCAFLLPHHAGLRHAIAVAQSEYNAFGGEVFAIKRQVLGADELSEHELKGQNALGKGQFKRQAQTGRSAWIDAVDRVFEALARHQARIFVVWTTEAGYGRSASRGSWLTDDDRRYVG